jgi:hypothetical protein
MLDHKAMDYLKPTFTSVNGGGSQPRFCGAKSIVISDARQSLNQPNERWPSRSGYIPSPTNAFIKRTYSEAFEKSAVTEAPPNHKLPPALRPSEYERRYNVEPQSRNGYQQVREQHPVEPVPNSMPTESPHAPLGGLNGSGAGGSSDPNRTDIRPIDPKRKRQFANRTKTGCGTCRRRKKKCDEAKPECRSRFL